LNEIANIIRAIADIRQINSDLASRSLDLTGSPNQIAAAEWIVNALENPGGRQTNFTQYQDPRTSDPSTIRVFFLKNAKTPQGVQEVVNAVRTLTSTQRIFAFAAPPAVVLRGTLDQDAASEWLMNALDTPENNSSAAEYHIPGNDPELMRVLAFPASWTSEKAMETIKQIRTSTAMRLLFPLTQARVIAVRGTAAQVEQAAQLVK
jgi:hypothetical protein